MPEAFCDRPGIEHSVLTHLVPNTWEERSHAVTIDPAVDDNVGDVNTLRPEFARHALGDHPKACLTGSEVGETRHPTKRP